MKNLIRATFATILVVMVVAFTNNSATTKKAANEQSTAKTTVPVKPVSYWNNGKPKNILVIGKTTELGTGLKAGNTLKEVPVLKSNPKDNTKINKEVAAADIVMVDASKITAADFGKNPYLKAANKLKKNIILENIKSDAMSSLGAIGVDARTAVVTPINDHSNHINIIESEGDITSPTKMIQKTGFIEATKEEFDALTTAQKAAYQKAKEEASKIKDVEIPVDNSTSTKKSNALSSLERLNETIKAIDNTEEVRKSYGTLKANVYGLPAGSYYQTFVGFGIRSFEVKGNEPISYGAQFAEINQDWEFTLFATNYPASAPYKFVEFIPVGTGVDPGQLKMDGKNRKGWFTRQVKLEHNRISGYSTCDRAAPENANAGFSVATQTGFSVGAEANNQKEATVSAQYSTSTTVTREFKDFDATTSTQSTYARWDYEMERNHSNYSKCALSGLGDCDIKDLPDWAKATMPLYGSSVWKAPSSYKGTDFFQFKIIYFPERIYLTGTNDGIINWEYFPTGFIFSRILTVNFASVSIAPL